MDPNANLKEMLELAQEIREAYDADETISETDSARLAELVEALDGWLSNKGFLPGRWSR
jgi:hypothetical protein